MAAISEGRLKSLFLILVSASFAFLAASSGLLADNQAPLAEGGALDIRPGDILFQALNTPQTNALVKATGSSWTHCGLVADRGGRLVVQEALMVMVETPLQDWIARGGGKVVVTRLKDQSLLTPEILAAMDEEFKKFIGKRYDILFQWSDERIYCSELVQKIYERVLGLSLAPLRKVGDYNLSDPAVEALIKKRFPEGLNPDEPAVAPVDLMESDLLVRVN